MQMNGKPNLSRLQFVQLFKVCIFYLKNFSYTYNNTLSYSLKLKRKST